MGLSLLIISLLVFSSCSGVRQETLPQSTYAVASWYGPAFQGRPTSSGETFNMYSYTCAHKEYPFGTRLKVTNASNNESVECIVNDRGPFVEGRDIDLSYACAKKIGLIGPGTGRVFLEVKGRDMSYVRSARVQAGGEQGPFAVQIGSFKGSTNAVRLKAGLSPEYDNVYIQEADLEGKKYYRVRIGDYGDFNKAVSVAGKLGQEGYEACVLKADPRK
ncbi:MAG: septal ring lytic transglycosylase RlpA family protein [Candidatus Sulfobium sp.]|jgi:rare lipoprotein A